MSRGIGPAEYRPETSEWRAWPQAPKSSRVTVPARCNAFARLVFAEMRRQLVTYEGIAEKSGVQRGTIKAWRTSANPGLLTLEAVLGALGWSLVAVPRHEHLPPALQAQLDALAAEWQRDASLLHELLATVCRAPILGEFNHKKGLAA